jgi:ribonuclease HI
MAEWRENQVAAPANMPEHWVTYFDSSLKIGGGGAGVLFISPIGEQLKYIFQILFEVSYNEAEYEALLHGLYVAVSLGIKRLLIYDNSLLVVQQVNKEWDINKETMDEIHKLENKFSSLEIIHMILDNNMGVDMLSKLGFDRAQVSSRVFDHELHHPSIRQPDSVIIDQGSSEPSQDVMLIEVDWRVSFIDFIKDWKLPPGIDEKSAEAARIAKRSKGYVLVNAKLLQAWFISRCPH